MRLGSFQFFFIGKEIILKRGNLLFRGIFECLKRWNEFRVIHSVMLQSISKILCGFFNGLPFTIYRAITIFKAQAVIMFAIWNSGAGNNIRGQILMGGNQPISLCRHKPSVTSRLEIFKGACDAK